MAPPTLLSLPPEIREQIYRECVQIESIQDEESFSIYKPDLAILSVNQLTHREAKKIFQEENVFVKIETPWPEASEHVLIEDHIPLAMKCSRASSFDKVHLRVSIECQDMPAPGLLYSMVILCKDLAMLTRSWNFSDLDHRRLNAHIKLHLFLQDPHVPNREISKSLQERLLLPFGMIKGLKGYDLEGMILPSVKETLEARAQTPNLTPEECIGLASYLKDTGNELIKANKCAAAIQFYFDAFKAIHIIVDGRIRTVYANGFFEHYLTSGEFVNQPADYVRMVLRIKLVANILLAYLKLSEWAEAYFWGRRTIMLYQDSITDENLLGDPTETDWLRTPTVISSPEMGKIYFRTSQAAKMLRKVDEVNSLVKAAAMCLPRDEAVKKELCASKSHSRATGTHAEAGNV